MKRLLALAVLAATLAGGAPTVIRGEVRALIPSHGSWLWVLNDSLVISPSPPRTLNGTWKVIPVNCFPGVNLNVLVKGPWVCKIEALNLLGKEVKPIVITNASIPKLKCDSRYLWGNLKDLVDKGNYLVIFFPISGDLTSSLGSFSSSICLKIDYNATIVNSTLVLRVTAKPLKQWIRICPPSKLVDVIVAWGEARDVKAYFNGKLVFQFSKTK